MQPHPKEMSGPLLAVHPEHVSLSFLISALVAPPPPDQGWGLGFDGPTAQRHLALFLLEEIQDISSPTLSSLAVLLTKVQQQLGQAGTVLAHALVGILRGLASPDDIVTVLHNFSTLLAQPGFTPAVATDACSIAYIGTTSPLGLFLRRVRLGLSSMSIQGLAALAGQIQQQLQDLARQQYQAAGAGSSTTASSSKALKDQAVLEAYVNQLMAAVETQGPSLPAALVEAATAQLENLEMELPKLQYLRMAVSLVHKDMPAALSALHTYFDSSGSATVGTSTAAATAAGTVGGPASTAAGLAAAAASKGKGKHQAALHSLSALHAALDHPQESLAALQELLRLGQQSGDEWGLLHALAGLCRVMGMSEGLELSSSAAGSSSSGGTASSSGQAAAPGDWVGWGLLDLRRTEQQLQLQTLLQRCLSTARDMRAPHIAAFAAVALCRFKLRHAAAAANGNNGSEAASIAAAAGASSGNEPSAAAAATSLTVQRMLLDVSTLEHQAAIAAAAPANPAVAAAPATAAGAIAPNIAARSTALYNPTEAFGTGTNSTVVTTLPTAGAATAKGQPVGRGWRSSAAAVSQALATAHLVAAAAMQLQGANSLAAVRLLMLLTGPGGGGAWRLPAAAAARGPAHQHQQQVQTNESVAPGPSQPQLQLPRGSGCATGCGVRFDDFIAGWVLAADLVAHTQGIAAAQHALGMAVAHFPNVIPEQLSAAQQLLQLKQALEIHDMKAARLACEELQSLAHPQPQLGLELQLAAAEADAMTQAAAGCWAEAHAAAASLFAVAAAAGMQPQAAKALLLMGRAALQAGDLAGALPYALSAMLHCQQLQLDALLPEAVLLVAAAWQGLAPGRSGFALEMLQQMMPVVCASGGLKLQGQLQEAIAKVLLQSVQDNGSSGTTAEAAPGVDGANIATKDDGQPAQQAAGTASERLSDAGQRLATAAALYEQVSCWSSACDVWMMLAHACNSIGQEEIRNHAAARWQAARQRLLLGMQAQFA